MTVVDFSVSIRGLAQKLRQVGRMQIGRILGTVPSDHGGYKALIDLIERSYFVRAELNAVTDLLVTKGIVTSYELQKAFDNDYRVLFEAVSKKWPEIEFTEAGCTIKDPKALAERMKREGWPP